MKIMVICPQTGTKKVFDAGSEQELTFIYKRNQPDEDNDNAYLIRVRRDPSDSTAKPRISITKLRKVPAGMLPNKANVKHLTLGPEGIDATSEVDTIPKDGSIDEKNRQIIILPVLPLKEEPLEKSSQLKEESLEKSSNLPGK
ncbi:hypothetical protein KR018_011248 [Drosophila ironensis]|nr:hypothetical protein KR018_011248 [Drosophila ironensis]